MEHTCTHTAILAFHGRSIFGWSCDDCTAIAKAIGSCEKLVNLSLRCHFLSDADVKIMVSNLGHLRILNSSGTSSLGLGGHLKDKTCTSIASKLPNLQDLNIAYQRLTFSSCGGNLMHMSLVDLML